MDGIGYLIGTFFVAFCMLAAILHILLNMRDESERASLWIIIVLAFPIFGVLLYLFAGISRRNTLGSRVAKSARQFDSEQTLSVQKVLATYNKNISRFVVTSAQNPSPPDVNAGFKMMLDRIFYDYPPLTSNSVELLCDGDSAYPKMIEIIRTAKHHIHLQSFIIANDEIGKMIFDVLEEKASEGVEIRVIYDSFGSFGAMFSHFFRHYSVKYPNFRIKPFSHATLFTPWRIQLRNHRKLLIVDGHTAFLGGINISADNFKLFNRKYPAIHDLHCMIRGPVIGEFQTSFLRDWCYASKDVPKDVVVSEAFPLPEIAGNNIVRSIASGHGHCFQGSEKVFYTASSTAKKYIWINTPYFVPDKPFLKSLRMAALRGIDVRILIPRNNNHWFMKMATRSLYETLISDGVRIFEREGNFSHAKAMLVDGEWTLFGSSNCDIRSFRLNYELDIVVSGGSFLNELHAQFEHEFNESVEISLREAVNRSFQLKITQALCALFTPVL